MNTVKKNLAGRFKEYFTSESKILRHLEAARCVAAEANYTVLSGFIQELIRELESACSISHSDYSNIPSNDEDIEGIYRHLVWLAKTSGWSGAKIHYLDVLYENIKNSEDG